jgi:carbamoyltransferase
LKKILGISAYYHDSAAAIVVGGEIIAAAQEERFTRKNTTPLFLKMQWHIACKKPILKYKI